MKLPILDPEEQEIEEAIISGKASHVPNQELEKKKLKESAVATLNKTKNVNLRLTQRTLFRLKNKAAFEGIPYQTLAASILHKYANS